MRGAVLGCCCSAATQWSPSGGSRRVPTASRLQCQDLMVAWTPVSYDLTCPEFVAQARPDIQAYWKPGESRYERLKCAFVLHIEAAYASQRNALTYQLPGYNNGAVAIAASVRILLDESWRMAALNSSTPEDRIPQQVRTISPARCRRPGRSPAPDFITPFSRSIPREGHGVLRRRRRYRRAGGRQSRMLNMPAPLWMNERQPWQAWNVECSVLRWRQAGRASRGSAAVIECWTARYGGAGLSADQDDARWPACQPLW